MKDKFIGTFISALLLLGVLSLIIYITVNKAQNDNHAPELEELISTDEDSNSNKIEPNETLIFSTEDNNTAASESSENIISYVEDDCTTIYEISDNVTLTVASHDNVKVTDPISFVNEIEENLDLLDALGSVNTRMSIDDVKTAKKHGIYIEINYNKGKKLIFNDSLDYDETIYKVRFSIAVAKYLYYCDIQYAEGNLTLVMSNDMFDVINKCISEYSK